MYARHLFEQVGYLKEDFDIKHLQRIDKDEEMAYYISVNRRSSTKLKGFSMIKQYETKCYKFDISNLGMSDVYALLSFYYFSTIDEDAKQVIHDVLTGFTEPDTSLNHYAKYDDAPSMHFVTNYCGEKKYRTVFYVSHEYDDIYPILKCRIQLSDSKPKSNSHKYHCVAEFSFDCGDLCYMNYFDEEDF